MGTGEKGRDPGEGPGTTLSAFKGVHKPWSSGWNFSVSQAVVLRSPSLKVMASSWRAGLPISLQAHRGGGSSVLQSRVLSGFEQIWTNFSLLESLQECTCVPVLCTPKPPPPYLPPHNQHPCPSFSSSPRHPGCPLSGMTFLLSLRTHPQPFSQPSATTPSSSYHKDVSE